MSNTIGYGTHEMNRNYAIEKKPVVTLGMCMRNCEKQVGDAIRSIIEQDFSHDLMEIIFVDDGSEDRTVSVVNSWIPKTDIRMEVFSYDWRGVGKSRNTIINNAKGDFIIWIDSDEIFPKSYVRELVEFMKKNPKVGIATGRLGFLPTWSLVLYLEILTQDVSHEEARRPRKVRLQKTKQLPGTGGAIFRIDALEQVNGFDDRLDGVGEDIDVANRIVKAGWQTSWLDHIFYETHGEMSTPGQLWKKYFWRGYHSRVLYIKNRNYFSLARISPLGSVIAGILYGIQAYKYSFMKKSFLIPLHFTFKMLAWFTGFMKSQISAH